MEVLSKQQILKVNNVKVRDYSRKFPEWIEVESDVGNCVIITPYYPFYHFLKDEEKSVYN